MTNLQSLRDAILLEADYLADRADWIEALLKNPAAASILRKRLAIGAGELRAREKMLHEVLAATDPAEAS